MNITFRPLTPADEPFLWEMLYQALYVPPGGTPFPREVLQEPDIACYAKRIVELRDGRIIRDETVANRRAAAADLLAWPESGSVVGSSRS